MEGKRKILKQKGKGTSIFKVNGKFDFLGLIKNLALPLGGGAIIGFLIKNSTTIYNSLKKPAFAVPGIVFPIAWSILYVLMGLAAYRIYMHNKNGENDGDAYFYYIVQLCVNFLWPFIFFSFRLYGISFLLIIILLILVIITVLKFKKVDMISAKLMIPYIAWLSYASVLCFFVWMYNEM